MNRKMFYTALRHNGEIVAFQVKGYSDGIFYYYKSNRFRTWHAIHPATGLSVASAHTRCMCQTVAFNSIEKIEEYMHKNGERDTAWFNSLSKVIDHEFKI